MQDEMNAWCEAMLPHIRELSPSAAERYCDRGRGRLPHYRAVATRLAAMKDVDAAVWQAGFLHGLHASLLTGLPGVSDEVRELVRARAALGSLSSPAELERNVLPRLDRRAALVLVIEQLHHADPDARLEAWAARFHVGPCELPRDARIRPRYAGSRTRTTEKYRDFLRTVVAPVARHVGLWNEADLAEDAALLLDSPERFRTIVAFARDASRPDGPCAARVAAVRRALGDGAAEVRWEWRHVSRLDTRLPRAPWPCPPQAERQAADWLANLIHSGFVTAVVDAPEECWTLLGRLHCAVRRHRNDAFRDYLARPTRDGYRALHTEVVVEMEDGSAATVAVRILPRSADSRRFEPTTAATGMLAGDGDEAPPRAPSESMQVFAPDGRAVTLRPGSTVLNFAYKIHNHMPALLRGAQVNRQRVHVLQALHPGDVVWLDVGEEPRPLPRGWEQAVPRETVRPIRHGFMAAYGRALRDRGRAVLREHLVSVGAGTPPDDQALDEVVGVVAAELGRQGFARAKNKPDWWYHRLGVHDAVERQELPVRRADRGGAMLRAFLARAGQEMLLRKALHEVSHEDQRLEAKWCARCSPGNEDHLVFQLKGERLFVHRADAPCATDTFPLSLHFPPPQYMTVLGDDRPGMAGDVLRVLYEHRLGIRRIDGVRRERGKGVIRVRMDPTPIERVVRARVELRRLPGVNFVWGPEDPPPYEERLLPPRETVAYEEVPSAPYVVGPPARGVSFYGMRGLVDELHRALERVRGETAPSGGHVLLNGPKRVGKSSAVLKLQDELPGRALMAYVEAGEGDDWHHCETHMMHSLRAAAASVTGATPEPFGATSLRELVEEVRDRLRLPVVLAFDEAMHMMAATSANGRVPELARFASQARATPGLLTLWIGPASARGPLRELAEVLQSATPAEPQSLNEDEAAALLSAQQSDQCGRIEVETVVVKRAYFLTRGNPFWLNALGKELFDHSRRGADRVRRFDRALMKTREAHVLNDEKLFIDRYRQPDPRSRTARIWELVLNRLAYAPDEPVRVQDEAALLREVNDRLQAGLDLPAWDDLLSEMELRGTIMRDPDERRCWIEAPLLAGHIRALADPKRRGEQWLR